MKFLDLMEIICQSAAEVPKLRRMASDGLKAIRDRRSMRSRTGRQSATGSNRGGRPPIELPWGDIAALRRRGKSWRDIRDRLEASGVRISHPWLIRRWNRRRHENVVRIVSRG